jgi:hypothetical protein
VICKDSKKIFNIRREILRRGDGVRGLRKPLIESYHVVKIRLEGGR